MDEVAKINDPQCELLLLRSCMGISRLYFTMRTCPPCVFEFAQRSFALCSSLECVVTTSRPGFGNWQWRVATLPFGFRGLGVYSAGDVLNFAFLMSQLWSAGLQTKPLRHGESTFSLSPRHMALWKSQKKDQTSDWIRTVPISGLGQTMNDKTNHCVLCYLLDGKEVDIGLDGGCDKPLRLADMLLYSWDTGLDVCVDVTGSMPLT
ncbi:hypothetical protein Tco_1067975 [Tanacetum coccineum]|uniref:Uncharacterized protein n=1 Tax=Tanacetum coccineum TaxID=301880 RepID=A0ABQ5HGI6_9ASTR